MGAAGFFAALNQDDAALVGVAPLLHRLDGGQTGEEGVAVVGCSPAVEAALLDDGGPRSQPLPPAGHGWLLVVMAVAQHGGLPAGGPRYRAGVGTGEGGHLDHDERGERGRWGGVSGGVRVGVEAHNIDLQADDRARFGPFLQQGHRPLDVTVAMPIGIEGRRKGRNGHVVNQGVDDLPLPHLFYRLEQRPAHNANANWLDPPRLRPTRREAAATVVA